MVVQALSNSEETLPQAEVAMEDLDNWAVVQRTMAVLQRTTAVSNCSKAIWMALDMVWTSTLGVETMLAVAGADGSVPLKIRHSPKAHPTFIHHEYP